MALIKCTECGKEISQKAKTCPSCGAPVKSIGNALADLQKATSGLGGLLGVVVLYFLLKYWFDRLF